MNAIWTKLLRADCAWPVACLLAIVVWVLPITAPAQEDEFTLEEEVKPPPDPERVAELTEVRSEAEFGIGYVSDDAFRFGRYNGLEQQGLFGVFDFAINRRGAYDGESAEYWSLTGSNLGLTSRQARFEYGHQGQYGFFVGYDQVPTFRSDSAMTIFEGSGDSNLTLPAGWVAGANTAGMTQLLPSLRDSDIEHMRRRLDLGFDAMLPHRWDVMTSYRRETKDGIKTVGAVIGNSGGNPRSVILPEPIDYVTDQIEAVISHADQRKQLQIGYYVSLFENENRSLTWQNPYAAIAGWDAAAGFPGGQGSLHLAPDNRFHQVSVRGGYNVSGQTRVTADVALGRMTQDEPFLPYTVNPLLAASITQPLPRGSLDGRIDTTAVNFRIASRLNWKFHWNAGYRYDERDNRTPRNEYVYIGGDSQTQNTGVTSDRRRFNEPYSYEEQALRFDAGYQLLSRLDVTLGAERREFERSFSEREKAVENSYNPGLKSDPSDLLSGGLRFSRADRHGSTYVGEEPFLSGYSSGFTSTVPGGWENAPGLRKYHLADRERDRLALFATLAPSAQWSVGLNADYLNDDYVESELGLTESRIESYTLDATYAPSATWSIYAFYTYEELRSDQNGRSIRGGATRVTDAVDATRSWFARHRDLVDTFGGGFNKEIVEDTLSVGLDYVHAESEGEVAVTTGTSLTAAPLLPSTTRLNSVSLYAAYKWKKDRTFKLRYWFEDYVSADWALDNVEPNTLANVTLLGENSVDYSVQVVFLSVAYRF